MSISTSASPETPIKVTYNGETLYAARSAAMIASDQLIEKHGSGKGIPTYENLYPTQTALAPAPVSAPLAPTPTPAPVVRGVTVDKEGADRSQASADAAVSAGFAPAQPIYTRGTMVIDLGVENAGASRRQYDALPFVGAEMNRFTGIISKENRRDVVVPTFSLEMGANSGHVKTQDGTRHYLTRRGFQSLLGNPTGIGGFSYLSRCAPDLRATNFNRWMADLRTQELARMADALRKSPVEPPSQVKLRIRNTPKPNGAKDEIFAVVSPGYASFDVDKIAQAVALAMPKDAKAEILYDGEGAQFDVLFHSNIQPEKYVAGEFFKAGIRVTTDDTGGGSIVVSALIWQNLCLNLIIIDEAQKPIARLKHYGSVEKLAEKFRAALPKALDAVKHFTQAWGYAVDERIDVAKLTVDDEEQRPDQSTDAIALVSGIFNGMLARKMLGQLTAKPETVKALVGAWQKDTSAAKGLTRAAVVNAVTRYAHEGQSNPWMEDALERAGGALLGVGGKAPALPYLPLAA